MWKAEDYQENHQRWVRRFTAEEIDELSSVADEFIAKKIPLTGISKVSFVGLRSLSIQTDRTNC